MALPAYYTEATLKTYMHEVVGNLSSLLTWSVSGGSYNEPVNAVLLTLDTSDLTAFTGSTNIKKVRAAAEYHVWNWVVRHSASLHRFSLDQQSFSPEQVHAHAKAERDRAEAALAGLGIEVQSSGTAYFDRLRSVDDPYDVQIPDEARMVLG